MSETKSILRNMLLSSLTLMLFFCHLESLEVNIEYYRENNLPDHLNCSQAKGDQTLITTKGWPRNASVIISQKRPNDEARIFTNDFKPINGVVCFSAGSMGYYPGEVVEYSFTDRKSGLKKDVKVVPYRLFAQSSEDDAKIELEVLNLLGSMYMLNFTGFKDGEALAYTSISYDEFISVNIKPQSILYSPAVVGKKGGTAELKIRRNSGEILSLQVPWGLEILKYALIDNQDGTQTRLIDTEDYRNQYPHIAEYFDAQKKTANELD